MWKTVLLLGLLYPLLPGYAAPPLTDKIALIVTPELAGNPAGLTMWDMVQVARDLFLFLKYHVILLNQTADIHPFVGAQIVIFYPGHGMNASRVLLFAHDAPIDLSTLLANIHCYRLLMFTAACFGGSWLQYRRAGRLIITAANDTLALLLADDYNPSPIIYPPSLLDLLFYGLLYSIEESFNRWESNMRTMYQHYYGDPRYYPVMYDGIPGEVFL